MLKLREFILANKNWETLLKEKPYALDWVEDEIEGAKYILFRYNMIDSDPTNEIVKEARGIIFARDGLDEEGNVGYEPACIPFFRFYNQAEPYADKLDWNTTVVQEKIDGSIIKLWHYNGRWNISTNGTINAYKTDLYSPCEEFSTYADMFNHCAYIQKLAIHELDTENTYIFELISPFNRIVVPYKETKIVHIGTRHNFPPYPELNVDIGIDKPRVYKFNTLEECLEMAKNLPYSEEGYVAVDGNFERNKIKSPAYLAVHHLKDNGVVNNKRLLELILKGEEGEFLAYFPEYTTVFERAKYKYNAFISANTQMAETMLNTKFENRKELALWVMAVCKDRQYYSPFFFQLADKKVANIIEFINGMTINKLEEVVFGG